MARAPSVAAGTITGLATFYARLLREVHGVIPALYTAAPDGRSFRRDTTHKYSSPECGRVNDHHQDEDTLRERLSMWPGFDLQ